MSIQLYKKGGLVIHKSTAKGSEGTLSLDSYDDADELGDELLRESGAMKDLIQVKNTIAAFQHPELLAAEKEREYDRVKLAAGIMMKSYMKQYKDQGYSEKEAKRMAMASASSYIQHEMKMIDARWKTAEGAAMKKAKFAAPI